MFFVTLAIKFCPLLDTFETFVFDDFWHNSDFIFVSFYSENWCCILLLIDIIIHICLHLFTLRGEKNIIKRHRMWRIRTHRYSWYDVKFVPPFRSQDTMQLHEWCCPGEFRNISEAWEIFLRSAVWFLDERSQEDRFLCGRPRTHREATYRFTMSDRPHRWKAWPP